MVIKKLNPKVLIYNRTNSLFRRFLQRVVVRLLFVARLRMIYVSVATKSLKFFSKRENVFQVFKKGFSIESTGTEGEFLSKSSTRDILMTT